MRGLPYFHETPEVRVVHAAMTPGRPLAEQPEEILCGSTAGEARLRQAIPDGWWHEHYHDDVPVVFGHHVTGAEPLVRDGKVYGIDTGACHGLRLTALTVPDLRLYSVPARADHWRATRDTYQVPVLRTRAWATMSWGKIDETVADHAADAAGDARAYLAAIAAWASAIRALVPTFAAQVAAIAARLGAAHGGPGEALTAAMEQHPAKRLLFIHARGRLDDAAITSRCGTPALTLALATALELDVAALATPP
jgi:hypothetical protein